MKSCRWIAAVATASMLSGCELLVFNAAGDVAVQQGNLIIYSTVMMLLIIVPVLALTIFFAIKYRESNTRSTYAPDWDHSISLEVIVWTVPLAIIICLAGLTWVATHRLDPYQPLSRVSVDKPIDENVRPLVIQVVAMDWKWVFLYPEYDIATVNEAATVVDRPVEFQITSTTVMTAFHVPDMGGMIYAMPGMQTTLNAVLNEAGDFPGQASHYNGAGFSQMNFRMKAFETEAGFAEWAETVRDGAPAFDRAAAIALDAKSIDHPVEYYSGIAEGLWDRILNMCLAEGKICRHDMMMVDALGGGGLDGLYNREMFAGICAAEDPWALMKLIKPEMAARSEQFVKAVIPPVPGASPFQSQTTVE